MTYNRASEKSSNLTYIALDKALEEALLNLQLQIESREATITHDPLPCVSADPTKMSLLFQNLIGNALKFCEGCPQIHISSADNDETYTISVSDNGIGIEPGFRDKAFTMFQRLHDKSRYPGSGLGLSICKKIVDFHRGKIWVEANASGGSTFFFSLPKQTRPAESFLDSEGKPRAPQEDYLNAAAAGRHLVQFYDELETLEANVGIFVEAGLRNRESVIILCRRKSWERYQRCLDQKGHDIAQLLREGHITFVDAELLLNRLLKAGEDKVTELFEVFCRQLIDKSFREHTQMRAFGELVDLLCEQGLTDTAVSVEKIWNRLVKEHGFDLFCGYRLAGLSQSRDNFKILDICGHHTHLLPQ
jgi:two-component sensor histidine kinase